MKQDTQHLHADLTHLKNAFPSTRIFVIGKGPSIANFKPFDQFQEHLCIGINNSYKYFPHCKYVVMWHFEFYEADQEYLQNQKDFTLLYSSFHKMSPELPNALDLKYCGDFPLPNKEFGSITYWERNPHEWMFKTTFATCVKLAWWMGSRHITLLGCDFSLEHGYTPDDKLLAVPVKLRNYTPEQILALQYEVFKHLQQELASAGVTLDRAFTPDDLTGVLSN
jgi:hypothetical protein